VLEYASWAGEVTVRFLNRGGTAINVEHVALQAFPRGYSPWHTRHYVYVDLELPEPLRVPPLDGKKYEVSVDVSEALPQLGINLMPPVVRVSARLSSGKRVEGDWRIWSKDGFPSDE
jgi:hypothetical protein